MRVLLLALTVGLALTLAACGDDNGSGVDAAAASCDTYCSTIQQNCSGVETQYTSRDVCLATCATFGQGTAGAQSGNNLECREYHAGAALGDATTHCVHAGPGGAGVCGANCDGFCATVIAACTGANLAYASLAECLDMCQGFADTEKYDVSDQAGDTLACRIYHSTVATADPLTHCMHTLPVSDTCR